VTPIVDILSRAARQCSVPEPSSWLGTGSLGVDELRDFMHETADDVLERIDWPQPISASHVITGTGAEGYALPEGMKRLQRGRFAVYERFRTRRDCMPVHDDGQWEYMKELGTAGAYRFYRLRGMPGAYHIDFYRPLEAGITVVVQYVCAGWIQNGTGKREEFTTGDDKSILPRRIMEAGIVWRFRERKGLEFEDKKAEYEALLARWSNGARRVVTFGTVETRPPWDVPIPDVIP
jgi:hypothetical protein